MLRKAAGFSVVKIQLGSTLTLQAVIDSSVQKRHRHKKCGKTFCLYVKLKMFTKRPLVLKRLHPSGLFDYVDFWKCLSAKIYTLKNLRMSKTTKGELRHSEDFFSFRISCQMATLTVDFRKHGELSIWQGIQTVTDRGNFILNFKHHGFSCLSTLLSRLWNLNFLMKERFYWI